MSRWTAPSGPKAPHRSPIPNRRQPDQAEQYLAGNKSRGFFLFALAGHSRTLVVVASIGVAADSRNHLRIGLLLGLPALALTGTLFVAVLISRRIGAYSTGKKK